MRLLYLTQVFETGEDPGSERHFFTCRHFARRGHEVVAITSNVDYKRGTVKHPNMGWNVTREVDGVRIHYVYSYAGFRGSFARRVWYYLTYWAAALLAGLRCERPSVIYAVSTPLTVGLLGLIISKIRGVPFVFEVTDVWPDAALAVGVVKEGVMITAARWAEALCYKTASAIVALTDGIRNTIISKSVPPDKVHLVTNGVDLSLFPAVPAGGSRLSLRTDLGCADRFVCMYLGAHGAYNALHTVIEAAEALRSERDYVFVLIGDGDEKARLQATAAERGVANVVFLPPIARREAAAYLAAADLFLLPNLRGPFYRMNLPNKLFDYLASAHPVVVAGEGESAELVARANAGRSVAPEDGEALAGAIRAVRALPDAERDAMGQAGRAYVLSHFDRERLSDDIATIIERTGASRGATCL
jgi:glycosyltransferase involved in cell wall biosynthesis